MRTLADEVSEACDRLLAAGLTLGDARLDAEVLARHVLGWDRARYLSRIYDPVQTTFSRQFVALVERRCKREPVSQITGCREFWGLSFEVTGAVLTPRPETELLVETALSVLTTPSRPQHIADVGTGTGCLAISLAHACRQARISATDTSAAALAVAKRNAAKHHVIDRINFYETPFLKGLSGSFDVIVSNPPYIPEQDLAGLAPEVARYEPTSALGGGVDGLTLIRTLVTDATSRLRAGGCLIMEIGAGQLEAVAELIDRNGHKLTSVRHDLQGFPRVVVIQRGSAVDISRGLNC